jgi:uncharacterized repeat protein (TIGR01451 family)
MKFLNKMISTHQALKKMHGTNALQILATCLLMGICALPMAANAQSSACAANELQLTYSFANPNNWDTGSATLKTTGLPITLGAGAAAVNVNGTATLANSSVGFPTTAPSGGFADSYNYQVDRTTTAATNTVTITFSKPISKLQLVATDLDYGVNGGGAYQDQVTILGNGPSGVVTPTAVATDPARVGIVGNVATSLSTSNGGNCPSAANAAGAGLCNATFSFPQPITSLTYNYGNGPGASGNPPEQMVGLAALGFCVQNPDLALVKDDGGASFVAGSTGTYTFTVSNVGSAATSGTTTVKDILPLGMSFGTPLTPGGANAAAWTCVRSTTTNANDTATCTSTTAIAAAGSSTFTLPVSVASTVASGTTLTNRAKVFGGNDPNKAAEATTGAISACPSDSLAGAVANAGCGFEDTPITAAASIVITKTDSKTIATSGGTNAYVVTLTNQGPSVANGAIVTDVVGAGLTCPGANVVTCSGEVNGAVCPAASTIATLTGVGITVATLPVNGALQFAYTCNVN